MIRLLERFPLKPMHTFRTEAYARYFFEFTEAADLQNFIKVRPDMTGGRKLILGGGSNLLFVGDFDGLVLYPHIPGIAVEREDRSQVWLRAGAGVVWDDLVEYAVSQGWGGVENLSLIPGNAGASPVQNIGAYGQEVSRVIESVTGVDLRTGELWEISADDCRFGYRSSIFKQELKEIFVITSVLYRLEKFPDLCLHYQGVAERAGSHGQPDVASVRRAIIDIRRSKLPDPEVTGNAGSFFKNPVVDAALAGALKGEYPDMPVYDASGEGLNKLSAGWLIDRCGWKGVRRGDAGVHEAHALVLVNHGHATGRQIFDLSEEIMESVRSRFGVELEREVNVIG